MPVTALKEAAFAISCRHTRRNRGSFCILASGYFEPLQLFNPLQSVTIVTMAVIGGSDDAPGPLFGVVLLVLLSELLWANAPEAYMVILGVLLVVFVLARPTVSTGGCRPCCGGGRGEPSAPRRRYAQVRRRSGA